jgi:Domain of unknown function (DUF4381)
MNSPDLSKLHDFYQPPPPSWIPQTVAWYVVFALLGLALIWLAVRALRKWMHNRYRRDALRELQSAPAAEFSVILKRAALVARPRSRVASLTGTEWTDFLAESSGISEYRSAPGAAIENAIFREQPLSSADENRLRQLAERWIKTHHG